MLDYVNNIFELLQTKSNKHHCKRKIFREQTNRSSKYDFVHVSAQRQREQFAGDQANSHQTADVAVGVQPELAVAAVHRGGEEAIFFHRFVEKRSRAAITTDI